MKRVCWDTETFSFPETFRLANSDVERLPLVPEMRVACVFHEATGQFEFYTPHEIHALIACLKDADEVISFNGKAYDLLVLEAHYGLTTKERAALNTRHIDLCEIIAKQSGRRISLDNLSRRHLGERKAAKGSDMAALELDSLKAACQSDVDQTYRLWRAWKDGKIRFPDREFYQLRTKIRRANPLWSDTVHESFDLSDFHISDAAQSIVNLSQNFRLWVYISDDVIEITEPEGGYFSEIFNELRDSPCHIGLYHHQEQSPHPFYYFVSPSVEQVKADIASTIERYQKAKGLDPERAKSQPEIDKPMPFAADGMERPKQSRRCHPIQKILAKKKGYLLFLKCSKLTIRSGSADFAHAVYALCRQQRIIAYVEGNKLDAYEIGYFSQNPAEQRRIFRGIQVTLATADSLIGIFSARTTLEEIETAIKQALRRTNNRHYRRR